MIRTLQPAEARYDVREADGFGVRVAVGRSSGSAGWRGGGGECGGVSVKHAVQEEDNVMLLTKRHYELMDNFEREYKHRRLDREKNKELWKRGNVYEDGAINDLFLAYRKGYAFGATFGDAANKLASAPVAIMDTRAALGLCALEEDDFQALYALQGHRVALVDLESSLGASGGAIDDGEAHEELHALQTR